MTKTYILPLLCIVFIFSACSRDKQMETFFSQADSLMEEYPDSALNLLKRLPISYKLSDKDCARYALLLAKATDKSEQSLLSCDSLLNIALHYYKDDEKERAVALLYEGRLEEEMNNTEKAISLLQDGLAILKRFPTETETRKNILSSLGNLYYDTKYYEEAIKIYRELYDCCVTDKDKSIAINAISSYYRITDKKDSTIITRYKALNYAVSSRDSDMTASSLLSLSLDYYMFEQLDSALHYAQKALSYIPLNEPKGRYYYHLGSLLLETEGNKDTASYYMNKGVEDSTFNDRFICLLGLSELKKEEGNYEAAIEYLEEYVDNLDSIITSEHSTKIQQLIYGYNTKMQVKEEQMKGQRILWRIIISSSMLCFLIILVYQNRINHKKRQQLQYAQELKQVYNKLSSLQTTINDNQSIISLLRKERCDLEEEQKKKELQIKEREQTILSLKKEKQNLSNWLFTQSDIYKKISTLFNQKETDKKKIKVLTVAEQKRLKDTILSIYAEYTANLRQTYPRLTDDDLVLLCLQENSFDVQTIAICFGYGDTHPINQRKSRIKERMKSE